MQLVVMTDEMLKQELLAGGQAANAHIEWIKNPEEFSRYDDAQGYCDLLFDGSGERIDLLKKLSHPIIVHSVDKTLGQLQAPFIRINGWPGFLKGTIMEASCNDERGRQAAEIFFSAFNKKIEWLPDQPGFVSPRVVAMIINEAYFALGEGVSTKQEIDVAMKLGTNYPYGPFEWAEKVGIRKIFDLLRALSKINSRYQPAPLLEKEALR